MFKNFIDKEILLWPDLFLKTTYEKSMMSVLDHVFFTIGNGFEWKNGYPLLHSGSKNLIDYPAVDIDLFFKKRKNIWMLVINNMKTHEFIKTFNFDYLKDFSSEKVIYIDDKHFAEHYNNEVKNIESDLEVFDVFDRIDKFDKATKIWYNSQVSFYPISKYSMINEINKQKVIQDETVEYALKLLDYAEKYYLNKKNEKDQLLKIEEARINLMSY